MIFFPQNAGNKPFSDFSYILIFLFICAFRSLYFFLSFILSLFLFPFLPACLCSFFLPFFLFKDKFSFLFFFSICIAVFSFFLSFFLSVFLSFFRNSLSTATWKYSSFLHSHGDKLINLCVTWLRNAKTRWRVSLSALEPSLRDKQLPSSALSGTSTNILVFVCIGQLVVRDLRIVSWAGLESTGAVTRAVSGFRGIRGYIRLQLLYVAHSLGRFLS